MAAFVRNRWQVQGPADAVNAVLARIGVGEPLTSFNRLIPMPDNVTRPRRWMIQHWGAASVFDLHTRVRNLPGSRSQLVIEFRSVPDSPTRVLLALSELFPRLSFFAQTESPMTGNRYVEVIRNGRIQRSQSLLGSTVSQKRPPI